MARAQTETREPFTPKGDEHLTLADHARAKRDCALLLKTFGKMPVLLAIWDDIKIAEAQLRVADNLDLEIERALRDAA